ncbi:MAG: calcium-binding protein [Sphingorhabdus sp.]
MSKTKIFSGLIAISLASAALYAAPSLKADANGDKAVSKNEAMVAADAHFAKMDVNADGKLDQSDRVAMVRKHFVEMDTDKSGSLNEAEFLAAHQSRMAQRNDHREMRMGRGQRDGSEHRGRGAHQGRHGGERGGMKMLEMADGNADMTVTKTEFRAAAEARFVKADTNGDGTISAEERKSQRKGNWRHPAVPLATPDADKE